MKSTMSWARLLPAAMLLIASNAFAQENPAEKCETFDEAASTDPTLSLAQMQFNTVQQARNRLLQSLGVSVRGITVIDRGGNNDSSYTSMQQGISQETRGWITRDTVLDWKTPDGGRSYVLKYSGCARATIGSRDPAFFAEVNLDKDPPAYVDNGRGNRDSIVVTIKVSRPAFLTVFFRTGDTLTVLYPSVLVGMPQRVELGTGATLRIPPAGNRLRTMLTGGAKKSQDWIYVVMTKQDVPLTVERGMNESLTLQRMTYHEYMAWLNSIPLEERFVAERPFSIQRTK